MRPLRPLLALSALALPLAVLPGLSPLATATSRAPEVASLVKGSPLVATVVAAVPPGKGAVSPGEPIPVTGSLGLRSVRGARVGVKPVAGSLALRLVTPRGRQLGRTARIVTSPDGGFRAVLPGSWTTGVRAGRESGYVVRLAVEVVDAVADGERAERAGMAAVPLATPEDGLVLVNDFTSAVGWVKPGETYPFRVILRNYGAAGASDVTVTVAPVAGMRFTKVTTAAGTASIGAGGIVWDVGDVAGTTDPLQPERVTLVVEARAQSLTEDPRIVWKDLSTVARATWTGGSAESRSHGPKVIPPEEIYDTARFGDRPFPVVPVDYYDRKHETEHSGDALADKINSPDVEGSTFNLFQEMSYGQLFPHGTVPSAGIAEAGWQSNFTSPHYADGKFDFTDPRPQGTCPPDGLVTAEPLQDTPAYQQRIVQGWYQLPGTTNYYGTDKTGSAIAGALTGQGLLFDIDSACGPTAKAVYDAAHIADPEIDYSDYDTDKDGVVDFFMMVFVGLGGNGVSQGLACNPTTPTLEDCPRPAPYDNIWPHSSSLEFTYTDQATGLAGYISDDQLKDLEGRPLWYTDDNRSRMTTSDTGDELKVFVRVGPYNVNPESAIDRASVISHEYGHSLGLPDFYSTGSRETYGDWNLMATDKSQNMDVFAKQEMGWIVPRVLPRGTKPVRGWRDSKVDTHRIDWVTPGGQSYALTGPDVHNGEAYTVKLPGRQIISPEKVEDGASPTHVWWSGSGNNFGCPPQQGHNLDFFIPELEDVPADAEVKLVFSSYWDIEWDYDYGFVLISPDGGRTYASVPSEKGYTTPATQNPNAVACQTRYGNGITGTSGSYEQGTQAIDRSASVPGRDQYPDGPFLEDSYDISALAGKQGIVRFAYATDPGLAHPGWFIDDVRVMVGDEVIWSTDFEDLEKDRERTFNGGCQDEVKISLFCTRGWNYIASDLPSPADHGYYLEMRDRSGFDFDGKGENDRAPIAFQPGMLLVYTDETHGYGNAGTDDPPAQSPLDRVPQPGESEPNLNDAAFQAGDKFDDANHVDNYEDPRTESGNWEFRFGCLSFQVDEMAGDDVGPDSKPGVGGDLVGDVTFTTTAQCAEFDYGYDGAAAANVGPTAVAAVKPARAEVGQQVTFDASQSFDDRDAPPDLRYRWDFGDGSTASGRVVRHSYAAAGKYTATLTVTDSSGLRATDTVAVEVRGRGGGGGEDRRRPIPATGGDDALPLLGLALAAAAIAARALRRG